MQSSVMRFVLVLCAAFSIFSSEARADSTLLTVTGAIDQVNREPHNSFEDALFSVLQIDFDRAYEFSREDLLSLPQETLSVQYPNWPRAIEVSGPLLKDVLDVPGARGDQVVVRAIDGYAPEFKLSEVETGGFVLALYEDERPLPLGGRGPIWLVFPQDAYTDQPEDDSGLAWAVFHIEVR